MIIGGYTIAIEQWRLLKYTEWSPLLYSAITHFYGCIKAYSDEFH